MLTLSELEKQNTPFTSTVNYSEGFPLGVPHGYSWYPGDAGPGDAAAKRLHLDDRLGGGLSGGRQGQFG